MYGEIAAKHPMVSALEAETVALALPGISSVLPSCLSKRVIHGVASAEANAIRYARLAKGELAPLAAEEASDRSTKCRVWQGCTVVSRATIREIQRCICHSTRTAASIRHFGAEIRSFEHALWWKARGAAIYREVLGLIQCKRRQRKEGSQNAANDKSSGHGCNQLLPNLADLKTPCVKLESKLLRV